MCGLHFAEKLMVTIYSGDCVRKKIIHIIWWLHKFRHFKDGAVWVCMENSFQKEDLLFPMKPDQSDGK